MPWKLLWSFSSGYLGKTQGYDGCVCGARQNLFLKKQINCPCCTSSWHWVTYCTRHPIQGLVQRCRHTPLSIPCACVASMSLQDQRVHRSPRPVLVSGWALPSQPGQAACGSTTVLTQGVALHLPSVLPVTVPGQRLCRAPVIKPDK